MLQKDTKSRKQAIKSQGIYLPFLRKTFKSIYYFNMENPVIHYLYESVTGTWQYIVADAETSCAGVIDPVLDFDPAKNRISTVSADRLLALIDQMGYKVDMILETHAHADHPTAASYLQATLSKRGNRPNICIGGRIKQVQKVFGERYNISPEEYEDAFDKPWDDDEQFKIGNLNAQVFHLPGHTPDHIGYKIAGKNSGDFFVVSQYFIASMYANQGFHD